MDGKAALVAVALLTSVSPPTSWCAEENSPDSFLAGEWSFDARYRIETVDQGGPLRTATAATLRTSVGFETNPEHALGAMLEVEDVHALGAEEFNSTTNGRSQYSVVADPDGTELNQAYASLRGGGMRARAGRQSFVLDNARFFGDVGFRQNQQTFDALTVQGATPGGSRFTYGYLWHVNRFLGEDHPLGELDMRTHVLNYSLGRLNGDRLTAYAYLLEFDEASLRGSSTKTFGVSYDGSVDVSTQKLLYRLEYADQSDYADNAGPADAWYANVEIGWRFASQWVTSIGVEMLSGDGTYAFQTPMATLHQFNGYADVFATATPADGIEDRYMRVYMPLAGTRLSVTLHDFRSDNSNRDYGNEIDAELYWRLSSNWFIGAKYADYKADDFAADTRKAWLWVQAEF